MEYNDVLYLSAFDIMLLYRVFHHLKFNCGGKRKPFSDFWGFQIDRGFKLVQMKDHAISQGEIH